MNKRTLILLCITAFLYGQLTGCTAKRPNNWETTDTTMMTAMVACQAADLGTTWYALDHGFEEANPIMPSNIEGIAAVKVVMTAAIAGMAYTTRDKRIRRQVMAIGAVFGCGPAIWNASHF